VSRTSQQGQRRTTPQVGSWGSGTRRLATGPFASCGALCRSADGVVYGNARPSPDTRTGHHTRTKSADTWRRSSWSALCLRQALALILTLVLTLALTLVLARIPFAKRGRLPSDGLVLAARDPDRTEDNR
jgi:hypothetical protein